MRGRTFKTMVYTLPAVADEEALGANSGMYSGISSTALTK